MFSKHYFSDDGVLLCTNVISAFPKMQSICDEIPERGATISFLTEIWQDINNPMHSNQLERALQLQGIEIINTPRRGRKGGGVAIDGTCPIIFL